MLKKYLGYFGIYENNFDRGSLKNNFKIEIDFRVSLFLAYLQKYFVVFNKMKIKYRNFV